MRLTCPPKAGPVNMLVLGHRKGGEMARKKHTPEQVINKLREAEVTIAGGGLPDRCDRADILLLAQRVRRSEDRPGQAKQHPGQAGAHAGDPFA